MDSPTDDGYAAFFNFSKKILGYTLLCMAWHFCLLVIEMVVVLFLDTLYFIQHGIANFFRYFKIQMHFTICYKNLCHLFMI